MKKFLNIFGRTKHNFWIITFFVLTCLFLYMIYLRMRGYTWQNWIGFENKTLWDWLSLVLLPLFVSGTVALLEKSERKADREIAEDNQREIALQNYFDAMTTLILDKGLRNSKEDEEVRNIAQAKTTSTLRRLDAERKVKLVRFLSSLSLLEGFYQNRVFPIISLEGEDLSETFLDEAQLKGVNMMGANLRYTDLSYTNLSGALLHSAILKNCTMEYTDLSNANLAFADLSDAILYNTKFIGAELRDVNLNNATYYKYTKWPEGFDPKAHGAILVSD